MINNFEIDKIIINALSEDIAQGDITTDNIIDKGKIIEAVLVSKDEGIIAGLDVAKKVFTTLDDTIQFENMVSDGDNIKIGEIIAEIKGNAMAILKGERTALNLLQHMSGISTSTNKFCEKVQNLDVKIVDTRKTTPGLRRLEKYAVKMGGGYNHRFCLSDGVMIKDNHIKAAGSIKRAIEIIRKNVPHTLKIEVETENLNQVNEALESGADIIMLDNMTLENMQKAVEIIGGRAIVEASGNVSIDTVYDIAYTGVDIISVGSLTHSVTAFDISMKIK